MTHRPDVQHYSNLTVWSDGHSIAVRIFRATETFPARERFGLASQMRRAATSIAANLAEGAKRATDRDFAHFVNIAEGSAAELEYLLLLGSELGLIEAAAAAELTRDLDSLSRRLNVLRQRLSKPRPAARP
jgi:four helix bundle protein